MVSSFQEEGSIKKKIEGCFEARKTQTLQNTYFRVSLETILKKNSHLYVCFSFQFWIKIYLHLHQRECTHFGSFNIRPGRTSRLRLDSEFKKPRRLLQQKRRSPQNRTLRQLIHDTIPRLLQLLSPVHSWLFRTFDINKKPYL